MSQNRTEKKHKITDNLLIGRVEGGRDYYLTLTDKKGNQTSEDLDEIDMSLLLSKIEDLLFFD